MGRKPTHGHYAKKSGEKVTPEVHRVMKEIFDTMEGQSIAFNREADKYLVELLARNLIKTRMIDDWLIEHGLFGDGGNPQPILRVLWQACNAAARICTQLGLSPSIRSRLGLSVVSGQGLLARVQDEEFENSELSENHGTD